MGDCSVLLKDTGKTQLVDEFKDLVIGSIQSLVAEVPVDGTFKRAGAATIGNPGDLSNTKVTAKADDPGNNDFVVRPTAMPFCFPMLKTVDEGSCLVDSGKDLEKGKVPFIGKQIHDLAVRWFSIPGRGSGHDQVLIGADS